MRETHPNTQPDGCRLDLWLWAARFFKTRSLAKAAITGGKIRVNREPVKPAKSVRVNDTLEIQRSGEVWMVQVTSLSDQRGSAEQAARLYHETPDSTATRLAAREQRRLEALGMQPPDGKPDKRARRLIRALGDIEAF
ncbi:RNA-binding protein [Ahniella affigens]|uniref:Heat shock protein 15 n=1 Tax=Ahniella affigens TaxID=2021234 RepID=A0A2P1PUI2_9GAMM|nr:S4 domain-containing protein [Ahniella affigens]AVP98503.1 RNA-binding protein [Ahniella affigens]